MHEHTSWDWERVPSPVHLSGTCSLSIPPLVRRPAWGAYNVTTSAMPAQLELARLALLADGKLVNVLATCEMRETRRVRVGVGVEYKSAVPQRGATAWGQKRGACALTLWALAALEVIRELLALALAALGALSKLPSVRATLWALAALRLHRRVWSELVGARFAWLTAVHAVEVEGLQALWALCGESGSRCGQKADERVSM